MNSLYRNFICCINIHIKSGALGFRLESLLFLYHVQPCRKGRKSICLLPHLRDGPNSINPWLWRLVEIERYCCWFRVVYPIWYRVFVDPRWSAGFLPINSIYIKWRAPEPSPQQFHNQNQFLMVFWGFKFLTLVITPKNDLNHIFFCQM